MRRTYACRLECDGDVSEAWVRAKALVRRWAEAGTPWPSELVDEIGTWEQGDGRTVRWRLLEGAAGRVYELTVVAPTRDRLGRRTDVQIAQTDTLAVDVFEGVLASSDQLDGSPVLAPRRPDVVVHLVDALECVDAGRPLTSTATAIEDERGADEVSRLLTHPRRRLPVLLGPSGSSGMDAVARDLAGLCHVRAVGRDAARHLDEVLGTLGDRELPPLVATLAQGEGLLHWAPTGARDPAGAHRGVRRTDLAASDGGRAPVREVVRDVWAAAALRLRESHLADDLAAEVSARRLADVEQRAETARAGDGAENAELLEAWEEDLKQRAELERRIDELLKERDAMAANLDRVFELFNEQLSSTLVVGDALPTNLAEAVAIAERTCRNLEFVPRAHASARESPFERPDLVLAALVRLDRLVGRWRSGTLDGQLAEIARGGGLNWAGGVSVTAQQQYAKEYTIEIDGRPQLLGPHIRFGKGPPSRHCRVYLWVDGQKKRVVVGHVGKHLPDASSD
jgi:hypothetical protein